jgi:hypothetical protein
MNLLSSLLFQNKKVNNSATILREFQHKKGKRSCRYYKKSLSSFLRNQKELTIIETVLTCLKSQLCTLKQVRWSILSKTASCLLWSPRTRSTSYAVRKQGDTGFSWNPKRSKSHSTTLRHSTTNQNSNYPIVKLARSRGIKSEKNLERRVLLSSRRKCWNEELTYLQNRSSSTKEYWSPRKEVANISISNLSQ